MKNPFPDIFGPAMRKQIEKALTVALIVVSFSLLALAICLMFQE